MHVGPSSDNQLPKDPMARIYKKPAIKSRCMADVDAELFSALDAKEFAAKAMVGRQTVHRWRAKSLIFGLRRGREYVYPIWQLDENGRPHECLHEIIKSLNRVCETPEEMLVSMLIGLKFLDGASIKHQIISGHFEDAKMQARMISGV